MCKYVVTRKTSAQTVMYGAETFTMKKLKKVHEKKLDVTAIRMLRRVCGVTKLDKIRNGRIRGMTKVGEISRKVQRKRLMWFRHEI